MTLTPKALELIRQAEERERVKRIRDEHIEWMDKNSRRSDAIEGYQAPTLDEYRNYHGFSLD